MSAIESRPVDVGSSVIFPSINPVSNVTHDGGLCSFNFSTTFAKSGLVRLPERIETTSFIESLCEGIVERLPFTKKCPCETS